MVYRTIYKNIDGESSLQELEIENEVRMPDGTVSDPSFKYIDDTDTGLYRVSSDSMGVALGGANEVTFAAGQTTFNNTVDCERLIFSTPNDSVRIGTNAGTTSQGASTVAIGNSAGYNNQGQYTVAIGNNAGYTGQLSSAIALGYFSGQTAQGLSAVAIGDKAGRNNQASKGVAIGFQTGSQTQGADAVAIGSQSGETNQGATAIAIGQLAGSAAQGAKAIAIGEKAGQTNQGAGAIAIGENAGNTNQGTNAIAIGEGAGVQLQPANSIILNASGNLFAPSTASSLYILPIREIAAHTTTGLLTYDSASREVGSNTAPQIPGVVTFTDTTESTTKDTGAVVVDGGVGIEKNLNVGGAADITGTTTQAKSIIDVSDTEALLVRKNGDTGDVMTVDTTNSIVTLAASLTNSVQPCLIVAANVNTISNNSTTTVTSWLTPTVNRGFTSWTSGVLTIAEAGIYLMSVQLSWEHVNTTGHRTSYILAGSRRLCYHIVNPDNNSQRTNYAGSAIFEFAAADTLSLKVFHTAGVDVDIGNASETSLTQSRLFVVKLF